MKLKVFSSKTFPKAWGGVKSSTPKVNFGKNGQIIFNVPACELMGLDDNSKVTIAQDEEDTANWYVFIDENGYCVKAKSKSKPEGLAFSHKSLKDAFAKAVASPADVSLNCLIAGKPTTIKGDKTQYWGLIPIPKI